MKEATSLRAGGETVASKFKVPVYCRRLQIKRAHHLAFGPAAVNLVMNWMVDH
jgi:hypothetical protein